MDYKFGWIKEPTDPRDYIEAALPAIKPQFKLPFFNNKKIVDNDKYVVPGKNQGDLGACIAHADYHAIGFLTNKKSGEAVEVSRLDLYWMLRFLMENRPPTEDTGGYLRNGLWALAHGVIPEKFWPYDISKYNESPPAYLYRFADAYKAVKYIRLDAPGVSRGHLLDSMKKWCEAGCPIVFGAFLGESYQDCFSSGFIHVPNFLKEKIIGGHAMTIPAGYDDERKAFRLQNSHAGFGGNDKFLGWISYDYVTQMHFHEPILSDVWAICDVDVLLTGQFG